jgi:hypothetical protein
LGVDGKTPEVEEPASGVEPAPTSDIQVGAREASGERKHSVHLASWDDFVPPATDSDAALLQQISELRRLCSVGLEARAKAGIPIRQPLVKLSIPPVIARSPKGDVAISSTENIDVAQFLRLIADELNVKEVIIDPALKDSVVLDTALTPELKREGMIRELTRTVNNLRKEMGLTPSDRIRVTYETDNAELAQAITEQQAQIERATVASKWSERGKTPEVEEVRRAGKTSGVEERSHVSHHTITIASAQITLDIAKA